MEEKHFRFMDHESNSGIQAGAKGGAFSTKQASDTGGEVHREFNFGGSQGYEVKRGIFRAE